MSTSGEAIADDGILSQPALGETEATKQSPTDASRSLAKARAYKVDQTNYVFLILPQDRSSKDNSHLQVLLDDIDSERLQSVSTEQLASCLMDGCDPPGTNEGSPSSPAASLAEVADVNEYNGEWATFEIDNTVFVAPASRFRDYAFFRDLLDHQKKGNIRLEGVNSDDFRILLKLFYPPSAAKPKKAGKKGAKLLWKLPTPAWISMLRLSSSLGIPELRAEAIAQLDQRGLKILARIMHGKEYAVQPWICQGYAHLIQRDSHIKSSEIAKLGLETTVKLHQAREMLYQEYYTKFFSDIAPNMTATHLQLSTLIRSELGNTPSQPQDVIERILAARSSESSQALMDAYEALTRREASLTLEEVNKLGLSSVETLWRARSALRKEYKEKVEKFTGVSYIPDIDSIMVAVFGSELNPKAEAPAVEPVTIETTSTPTRSTDPVQTPPAPLSKKVESPPIVDEVTPKHTSAVPPPEQVEVVKPTEEPSSPRLISLGPGAWSPSSISRCSAGEKGSQDFGKLTDLDMAKVDFEGEAPCLKSPGLVYPPGPASSVGSVGEAPLKKKKKKKGRR